MAALEKLYEEYKENNPQLGELSLLKYKKFPSKSTIQRRRPVVTKETVEV